MMNQGAFTMDVSDFDKKFTRIVETTIPEILAEGLFKAGGMLLRDAIKDPPRAPHLTGELWRHQQVNKPVTSRDSIEVDAGFNIVYAAYQHEGQRKDGTHVVKQYSTGRTLKSKRGKSVPERVPAGSSEFGKKFLSTKMSVNREKYMTFVAQYCLAKSTGGAMLG